MSSTTTSPRRRPKLLTVRARRLLLVVLLPLVVFGRFRAHLTSYLPNLGDAFGQGKFLGATSSPSNNVSLSYSIFSNHSSNNNGTNVAFITYAQLKGTSDTEKTVIRFKNMIFGALETWLSGEPAYFVVMTHESKRHYDKFCGKNTKYEALCQRIISIPVSCPEGYYGDSPCCKTQEGLLAITKNFPQFDYYYFGDDDMYVRTSFLNDFLQDLSPDYAVALTPNPLKRLGHSSFGSDANDKQQCSPDHQYMYPWGQPIIYSRAAIQRIQKGLKLDGFRKQCREFEITHDVGLQIFNWMYELPAIIFDIHFTPPGSQEDLAIHGVAKTDKVASMQDMHRRYVNLPHPKRPYRYWWHNTTAFRETTTYKTYGAVDSWDTWHTMPFRDCRGPVEGTPLPPQAEQVAKLSRSSYDVCVVGAGLSGSVLAEQYAYRMKKDVLLMEKRHHVGGNCYDYIDEDTGIRVSKYGAHLFHTKTKRVWDYVQKFTKWTPYEHKVIGLVNNKYVPIPVNIDTINTLFGLNISSESEMDGWLKKEQVQYDHEPQNSEEMALSRVGSQLYNLIFRPYTKKQWDKEPSELGPEVTARIPVRNNFDGRYFSDPYQALPSAGYTSLFRNMYGRAYRNRGGSIEVHLNVDYFDVRDAITCGRTYYTGPIDVYFGDLGMKKLEYRSLDFERRVIRNVTTFQPAFVVNHPSAEENFTRIVEYKHLPIQPSGLVSNGTVIFIEHSKDGGEPYYPVPNKENIELHAKYQEMAEREKGVKFVGRLANYKYFNMDEAILNALEIFDADSRVPF